jgi:hypothetical protein
VLFRSHHSSAGPRHASNLAQPGGVVREVAQPKADGDRVEGRVCPRKRERIPDAVLGQSRARRNAAATRQVEHALTDVSADHVPPPADGHCRGAGQRARAARHVQGMHPRAQSGGTDRVAAPAPIDPRRHERVHGVVQRRDAIEHPADRLGWRGVAPLGEPLQAVEVGRRHPLTPAAGPGAAHRPGWDADRSPHERTGARSRRETIRGRRVVGDSGFEPLTSRM